MAGRTLETRLLLATNTWQELIGGSLPRLTATSPHAQIEELELRLVELLCEGSTAETAADVADRTWELVYDRPDDDRVKRRVVECHERLAALVGRG